LANGSMACYYRRRCAGTESGTGPGRLEAAAAEVARADAALKDLDPAVQWVEGDWFLAPPAKAVGAQAASRALALQLVQLVSPMPIPTKSKRCCARIRRCRITC
jgi:EAL and modified HD-GYP domain-containing signal transduction protein